MTLIVEDGTGLANSNSFVSVAEADDYLGNVGATAWSEATLDAKEAALIRATAYLSTYFRWKGARVNGRAQALSYPRQGVTDCEGNAVPSDAVPVEVKAATYQAALFELSNPFGLSPQITPSQQNKRVKVGPVEVEYRDLDSGTRGDADGIDDSRVVLSAVEDLLRCLVVGRILTPHPLAV